jgi:SPP1 family predicted phage head-tail adaptor
MYAPQTGRETMRAESVSGEARAMFVIRFRSWLTTDHVITIRGTIYEIHSIVDVEGRRRFQELIISERIAPMLTS